MITSAEWVCGYTVFRTGHAKLVIFETFKGESFIGSYKLAVNNVDLFAYVNSKFIYVEKYIKTQMRNMYRVVLLQRYNLERETLENALAIAPQAPDEYAFNLMKGPRYMTVTPEVVHVIKCILVEVMIQHGDECYAELKVMKGNSTYFLTPI